MRFRLTSLGPEALLLALFFAAVTVANALARTIR
jgi:hypothetical protein